MAKVQTYVSNELVEKINAIVEKRRMEGAHEKDISFSSVVSMLLELGLRVYQAQMERKESGFDQMSFNRILLESVLKTRFSVNKIMGMECLSPHVKDITKFEWDKLVEVIQEDVQTVMNKYFPEMQEEEN